MYKDLAKASGLRLAEADARHDSGRWLVHSLEGEPWNSTVTVTGQEARPTANNVEVTMQASRIQKRRYPKSRLWLAGFGQGTCIPTGFDRRSTDRAKLDSRRAAVLRL